MMKNPYKDLSIFRLKTKDSIIMIVIGYSEGGIVRAFNGFSDNVVGTAHGGGYDKQASVLKKAIKKRFGLTLDDSSLEVLTKDAARYGIEVESLSTLIYK